MAKPPKAKNNDNKTVPEKAVKTLTPQKQLEADHLAGKHKAENGDKLGCGFCERRTQRHLKKVDATKRYFASQKS